MVELGALLLLVVVLAALGTLAYGALSAAPWVPLPQCDVERLLKVVALRPGEVMFDLGCGDGRVLLLAAERYGARAVGFELALIPYLIAHLRRLASPARSLISLRYQNFWHINLVEADAVVCFLTPYAIRKLEPKIVSELKPGARFATYAFKLHNTKPTFVNRDAKHSAPIYLYT